MTRIFVARERHPGESRAALVPATVGKLVKLGARVEAESGLGTAIFQTDENYRAAGAAVVGNDETAAAREAADIIVRLRKPVAGECNGLKRGCIHLSYLDPFNERELLARLAAAGVSAVCMEMIPRSTVAQKMDALSSQANLAGYICR